ncbi:MAG TPA: hypothetical protein VM368_04410 [Flavisolibacter sp.]|nr:hypothetical protein [Flavisolibacter sp.]
MKKAVFKLSSISIALVTLLVLQGCIKDTITTTYTYTMHIPVYKTKAQVRENIKSNNTRSLEKTGKLYLYGSYIFLNEIDKGIHVIDNSNPAAPVNKAFIDIPGNRDIAVKGNILYADMYTDLVAIDISNPNSVQVKKVIENTFPHRYYDGWFAADTSKVIVEWIKRDTTVTEAIHMGSWGRKDAMFLQAGGNTGNSAGGGAAPTGMGGSMARFAIVDKTLYTVGTAELKVFNISTATDPSFVVKKHIGMNIETIFPFQNKLFIGSATGMYIYDISNASNPIQQSQFNHVRSCDPVIADQKYAYVTLRSGTQCLGFTNQLEVIDITNLNSPQLVKIYSMTNPHGLSKDGSTLFICDGRDGLKIYNASNVNNLQLIHKISGIETYDVITVNGVAMVVAKDGLYQYDYSQLNNIRLLSKITITKP